MKHLTILVLVLIILNPSAALALKFKDEGLSKGKTISLSDSISETEIHGDTTFANFWNNGVSGGSDGYNAIWDYRIEAHTPLYKLGAHHGRLVTRVEGFAAIDHPGVDNFWDDQLVDIPELFWQDDFKVKGNDASFVFGKFANRRFFDKDEIAPDPFDIGERPFFGTLANTNNVFNRINERRDGDLINSVQASGSYGFMTSLKDNDGEGFFDRWGFKQGFAVAQVDNFGNNFYGVSELNKNWGKNKPGQFNLGIVYAQDDVFRNGSSENSYLTYSSWVQKWHSKFTTYFRYGLLNSSNPTVGDYTENHITTGMVFKPTKKDIFASHLTWFETEASTSPLIHLNFWIHKFNKNINSTVYYIWKYGVPSTSGFGGEDNNWFIGGGLTATL